MSNDREEIRKIVSLLESAYPDSEAGVKAFMDKESTLDITRAKPDPEVNGVWLALDDVNKIAAIVYLNDNDFEVVNYHDAVHFYFKD
jgi:hypothetical protein